MKLYDITLHEKESGRHIGTRRDLTDKQVNDAKQQFKELDVKVVPQPDEKEDK